MKTGVTTDDRMAVPFSSHDIAAPRFNHRLGLTVVAGTVVFFLIDRVIWAVTGILLTSTRRLLNLPPLVDSVFGIVNIVIIGLIQILLWTVVTRVILGRSLLEIGLRMEPHWWRELFYGTAMTALVLVIVFVMEVMIGWLKVDYWMWERKPFDEWLFILFKSITICTFVGIGEEIIFRGFVLTGLDEAWGERTGLVIMAVLFTLPHFTVSGTGDILLPYTIMLVAWSLLSGYAYLRTKSLWLPIGMHFSFNFVAMDLVNLAADPSSNLFGAMTRLELPKWLVSTGLMEFGFLGLVLALAITAAGIWFWVMRFHGTEPGMTSKSS